jgi:hypothetical protein
VFHSVTRCVNVATSPARDQRTLLPISAPKRSSHRNNMAPPIVKLEDVHKPLLNDNALMMEAISTFETPLLFYETTRRSIAESCRLLNCSAVLPTGEEGVRHCGLRHDPTPCWSDLSFFNSASVTGVTHVWCSKHESKIVHFL